MECIRLPAKRLDFCDLQVMPIEALMYQGGYLTIKSVTMDGDLVLGLPNREVREAVYGGFLDGVLRQRSDDFVSRTRELVALLDADSIDVKKMRDLLTSVFAMVPHEWKMKNEAEAKRYFLLFMKIAGANIIPEFESAQGRADAVLKTADTVCIFEFKYGKSTRLALRQIAEKGYAMPYVGDRYKVVSIGVNYNPKTSEIAVSAEVIDGPVKCGGGPVKCGGGPVKCGGGPVKSGGGPVKSGGGPGKLLAVICDNPGLRKGELSRYSGITERSIKRYLTFLADKVEFRGAPKTGGYYCK